MLEKIRGTLFSKDLPKWFKFLNLSILLPILLWPWILFSTIFLFDNPKNLGLTYTIFILVNAYPIYLLIIAYFNSLLHQKNKTLGSILPSAILLAGIYSVVNVAITISKESLKNAKIEREMEKQGYVFGNKDFRILHDKVYHQDTLLVGADAKTFEIISWDWQRDKNYCYHFGKKIATIDRKTFQLFDYGYAKDQYHVYYRGDIIEEADAKTFYHIEATEDGKDVRNCFRQGEKVDCTVLLTEE